MKLPLAAGLLVAVVVLSAALALWLRRRLQRLRLRQRFRRAAAGQERARAVLEGEGFHIAAEELVVPGQLEVDGVPHGFEVRIDFLVERRGRTYGVEVKTGARAGDPLCRATRRQLGEYARLLPVDGLYLLDMEGPRLMEVRFPDAAVTGRGQLLPFLLGLLLGGVVVLLLLVIRR